MRSLTALALCTTLLSAAGALAQDTEEPRLVELEPATEPDPPQPADSSHDREGRALFEAGRVAFDEGRYDNAIEYFERAYELSGRHSLLYNMGNAAERLQQDEAALGYFEAYLDKVPDADNRAGVQTRIAALKKAVADRKALEAAPPPVAEPTAQIQPTPATADRGASPWPWVMIAGGAAVAVGGGVMLAVAGSDVSTVEDARAPTRWADIESAHDRAPVLSGVGAVMLGVGAAAMMIGIVWVLSDEGDSRVQVGLGPGTLRVGGTL